MTLDQVADKVRLVERNLADLARIPQQDFDEFASDFRNLHSALHLLQTSIQALVDIGSYVSARLGLPAPRTSRDVFEQLEAAGHLPAGTVTRAGPIIGFRNRIVHLYDRVDPQIVFRILRERRDDLGDLLRLLVEQLPSAA
jgi:uncharacterized protein YutE (UPF0331/DUF86 family)